MRDPIEPIIPIKVSSKEAKRIYKNLDGHMRQIKQMSGVNEDLLGAIEDKGINEKPNSIGSCLGDGEENPINCAIKYIMPEEISFRCDMLSKGWDIVRDDEDFLFYEYREKGKVVACADYNKKTCSYVKYDPSQIIKLREI